MRRLLWLMILALSPALAHATNCALAAGSSQSTFQGAINAAASNSCTGTANGATVQLSAGTYSITSQMTLPCPTSPATLQGPVPAGVGVSWPITPTAVLSSTVGLNWTFAGAACSVGWTLQYLQYNANLPAGGGGGFLSIPPGMNNLTVQWNWIYGNNAIQQTTQLVDTMIYFNGSTSGAYNQNINILWNRFGQVGGRECGGNGSDGNPAGVNSGLMNLNGSGNFCSTNGYAPPSGTTTCLYQGASDTTHGGGSCGAIGVNNSFLTLNIKNNSVTDMEEPFKFYEAPAGQSFPPPQNLLVQYNDLQGAHRIGNEAQFAGVTTGPFETWDSNDYTNPLEPNAGTWALSLPQGTANSTNNVLAANIAVGLDKNGQTGYFSGNGIEFWGTGTSSNNLIQGHFATGIFYGYGGSPWSINNNIIQLIAGQYIGNEEGLPTPPSQSGNVTSTTVAARTSVAPTISPASGAQSFPLIVTFTDPGYTSGVGPLGNTGIWYTTDGSNPVPGSGTAKYVASGGQISLSSAASVHAVGMWGALNQPTSYATGYGFVPSAPVSATYTGGGGTPTAATPVLTPASETFSVSVSVSVADSTPSSTIYCTTDGSVPTTGSPVYSGPFTVTTTTTINCIAAASGYLNSAVGTGTYTNGTPTTATPSFSPVPTSFVGSVTVTVSDSTPSSTIHCTTDGSTPTTGSPVYSSPFTFTATTILQCLATASGYNTSAVGGGQYTLQTASTKFQCTGNCTMSGDFTITP